MSFVVGMSGCAWTPPNAYPVLDVWSDPSKKSNGEKTDAQKAFDLSLDITVDAVVAKLQVQTDYYRYRSERARTGALDLRTGAIGGAVTGAVGAIIGNVATTAAGAGIAAGSTLFMTQYSLTAQDAIFAGAAAQSACVVAAASPILGSSRLVPELKNASNRILGNVQSSLSALQPKWPSASDLAQAFDSARGVLSKTTTQRDEAAVDTLVRANLVSCIETGRLASEAVVQK
ncbi:hypothetical protein WJ972_32415 [Achromobacter insuavis]